MKELTNEQLLVLVGNSLYPTVEALKVILEISNRLAHAQKAVDAVEKIKELAEKGILYPSETSKLVLKIIDEATKEQGK